MPRSLQNARNALRSKTDSSRAKPLPLHPSLLLSGSGGRDEASCHLHPLRYTAAFLSFDIDNIGIASAPAADTVFFLRVPFRPVLVFFPPSAPILVQCWCAIRRFLAGIVSWAVIWCSWHLPRWSVRRTVLDCRVSISNVTEVVDLIGGEERAGGQGVDGCVTPLSISQYRCSNKRVEVA